MEKLAELNKLEKLLREGGYNVSRYDEAGRIWNRHQVLVKDDKGERMFDAICQNGSYGYKDGLLEIMNGTLTLTKDGEDGEVEGWLTADEIIKRLKEVG